MTTVQNPASGKTYTWRSGAAAAVRAEGARVLAGRMVSTYSEVDALCVSSYSGQPLMSVHVHARASGSFCFSG